MRRLDLDGTTQVGVSTNGATSAAVDGRAGAMLDTPRAPTAQRIMEDHATALGELLKSLDCTVLERVVEMLSAVRHAGGTIFVAGNGGSATTATHLANDLCKATRTPLKPPMRVLSLTDNVSWFTALANDEGYERAFAGQLENLARPGDVLIVISASGNSPNLLSAVEAARANGAATCALLGFDGGRLLALVDEALWLQTPAGQYALVEDAHSALCHIITLCLCDGA
jgi:D-sedoheptulose 7-phosphate isomerase